MGASSTERGDAVLNDERIRPRRGFAPTYEARQRGDDPRAGHMRLCYGCSEEKPATEIYVCCGYVICEKCACKLAEAGGT